MAIQVKNATGYNYAFGTDDVDIDGVEIETCEFDTTAQVDAEGIGQDGLVKAWAVGGIQGTITINGYLVGTAPAFGDEFTIDTQKAYVVGVKTSRSNREFKKIQITGKFYEGIGTTGGGG